MTEYIVNNLVFLLLFSNVALSRFDFSLKFLQTNTISIFKTLLSMEVGTRTFGLYPISNINDENSGKLLQIKFGNIEKPNVDFLLILSH